MAYHGPSYGLSAECERKRQATYDRGLETELRGWIEQASGERIGADFHDTLKSGVVLCKLMNHYRPGSCRFSAARAAFPMMENIESFLNACRQAGIPNPDLFMTVDLYEAKNMNQVLQCLASLRRIMTGVKSGAAPSPVNVMESAPAPARSSPSMPPRTSTAPSIPPRNSSPSQPARNISPSQPARSSPATQPARGGSPSGAVNFCPDCGTKTAGAKFCPNCGKKLM
eukprot:TRINITY_DN3054_c0_g1_i1.p1 TRINITY_DN3054_c0_g1~~TRINITY_DN3054_c0_g1_i1.p1  ORF type:complete len:253 (-),score=36.69 TRINITY_DN3054_c0_g1_i1:88-768(-)